MPKAKPPGNNAEGDTKKVNRKLIVLGYSTQRMDYQKDTSGNLTPTGTAKTVTGSVPLYYSENLINYFDIPVFTGTIPEDAIKFVNIGQFSYQRYDSPTDTAGRLITVRSHTKAVGNRSQKVKQISAVVPLDSLTGRGKARTISLAFPYWFNVQMILQAVGSMIRSTTHKPNFVRLPSGIKYPVPYNTATAPLTGFEHGAWITNTWIAGNNEDNLDSVPSTSQPVIGSSGQTASDNTAA